jgi:protein-tyrosine-phosphatase/DNA-binding transcriptional ArsR family regulator
MDVMTHRDVVSALAALAHEARLAVFKLLVQTGPQGLAAGVLAERLAMAPSALSFHLKELTQAGLLLQKPDGRKLIYSARFDTMNALIGHLTDNCCSGAPCGVEPRLPTAITPTQPGDNMSLTPYNVLFLCTSNSARSILAEAQMNALAPHRFKAYSAGSQPVAAVNPFTLQFLRESGLPTEGLRSKSWQEFAAEGAPHMDFVITVCDQAAGEVCPVWPGHPAIAHWGAPDPAAATGTDADKHHAFVAVAAVLRRRIELFTSLPLDSLDHLARLQHLADIGQAT